MRFFSDTKPSRSLDDDDDDDHDTNGTTTMNTKNDCSENDDDDDDGNDERMSFIHNNKSRAIKDISNSSSRSTGSSRSATSSGSGSSSSRSKKRLYILLIATSFVVVLLIGRWMGLMNSGDDTFTTMTSAMIDRNNSSTSSIPPPPFRVPKTNDALLPGYKKPLSEVSNAYVKRGKTTLTDEQRDAMSQQFGYWNFTHPPQQQPLHAMYAQYTHQDIPRAEFPMGAWQTNTTYLSEFLPTAIRYVEHCMEALLAEYGHSKYDEVDKPSIWERAYMFDITEFQSNKDIKYDMKHPPGNAGYASSATMTAIQKRLLHSIMTENSFTVVMGGHSAAAGHGNHFQQSYTLQVQRIVEPILARLGVTHKSHNYGMGGLGTIQNALGMSNLYGTDTDILIWDSGMTEGDNPSKDLFARVGLLSGVNKVPILWGRPDDGRYDAIAAGTGSIMTGFYGMSSAGIPETQNAAQVKSIPYAARYVQCSNEANNDICKNSRYQAKCWVASNTTVTPMTNQKAQPGGQAKWHPGNRYHQLQGRGIAFQIVHQLYNALTAWSNAPNYDIPDSAWHLTDDFQRIQDSVRKTKNTPCYELNLPDTICTVPLQSRSEFTPRYNPAVSSIRSILKEGVWVSKPPKNMYDPHLEPHLDLFDAPYPQVDVLSLIENGIDFVPNRIRTEILAGYHAPVRQRQLMSDEQPPSYENYEPERKPITSGLEPGQGWALKTKSAPDNCDGSYDSFCGRSWDNDCLLSGHNDMRGGLGFDSYSGWLIMNLENVKHGIIMIRVEDWWGPYDNDRTKNWGCENMNVHKDCLAANRRRQLQEHTNATSDRIESTSLSSPRRNMGVNPNRCSTFTFEFAIDGVITSWSSKDWETNRRPIQRVVPIWVLSNGAKYNVTDTGRDVELAIRLIGCERLTTFGLSHVYWA